MPRFPAPENPGNGETPVDPPVEDPDAPLDSDGDSLSDEDEIALGLDPNNADSDFDGFDDGIERLNETDALDPNSYPGSTPPVEEEPQDSDGDNLSDEDEALFGTDVNNPDTDGDGQQDGSDLDPLNPEVQ